MKIDSSHISSKPSPRATEARSWPIDVDHSDNAANARIVAEKNLSAHPRETQKTITSSIASIISPSHFSLEGGSAPEYITDLLCYVIDELLPSISEDDSLFVAAKQMLEEEIECQKQVLIEVSDEHIVASISDTNNDDYYE